jgi:hypothetical protein
MAHHSSPVNSNLLLLCAVSNKRMVLMLFSLSNDVIRLARSSVDAASALGPR